MGNRSTDAAIRLPGSTTETMAAVANDQKSIYLRRYIGVGINCNLYAGISFDKEYNQGVSRHSIRTYCMGEHGIRRES